MHQYENPGDGTRSPDDGGDRLVVAVVRTGGIVGLRRRWRVQADPEQAPTWLELVQRCPWDERIEPDAQGADRYVWSIHAQVHDEQLTQVVPESRLNGAWRDLVDAVRAADADADTA